MAERAGRSAASRRSPARCTARPTCRGAGAPWWPWAPAAPAGLTDDGRSWLPLDTLAYWSVTFVNSKAGWMVGPEGRITRVGVLIAGNGKRETGTAQTAACYLLAPEHADAIQRLAADPRIAATSSIPHPYPETGARDFIAQQLADRAAGRAWAFAIMDRGELVGVCAVHGLGPGEMPELGYWVGVPYWGRGHASFGLRMLLRVRLQQPRAGAGRRAGARGQPGLGPGAHQERLPVRLPAAQHRSGAACPGRAGGLLHPHP